MAITNPYEPEQADSGAPPAPAFYWRIPFLCVAAMIATIPLYGYFVHAARDSQLIGLLIVLCWFLTWPLAIGSIVVAVNRPPSSRKARIWALGLIVYLVIAGAIGMGGMFDAFYELIAG